MKVYISGAITNVPNYKELFAKAKQELESANIGIECVDPSCLHEGMTYKQYIDITLEMLKSCDAIFILENWRDSKGVSLELAYARTVGLEIYFQEVGYEVG